MPIEVIDPHSGSHKMVCDQISLFLEVADLKNYDEHIQIKFVPHPAEHITELFGEEIPAISFEFHSLELWFPIINYEEVVDHERWMLGTPEILDVSGHQRSVRLTELNNIRVLGFPNSKVLTLSSTGISLELEPEDVDLLKESSMDLILELGDEGDRFPLEVDAVRWDEGFVAAKFCHSYQTCETLKHHICQQFIPQIRTELLNTAPSQQIA